MRQPLHSPGVVLLILPLLVGGCASSRDTAPQPGPGDGPPSATEADAPVRLVQPGAPGEPSRVLPAGELGEMGPLPYTDADVRFMQGMIPHHAQALDMAALVAERTRNDEIHLLARRIAISQRDEIALMRTWLKTRGQEAPGEHAHHMMEDHLMPGMLTAEDMRALERARGEEFDRLFLEFMIMHHEGALVMVQSLFASPGAGQETDIYTFASHVDADQQIEIRRMSRMLAAGG